MFNWFNWWQVKWVKTLVEGCTGKSYKTQTSTPHQTSSLHTFSPLCGAVCYSGACLVYHVQHFFIFLILTEVNPVEFSVQRSLFMYLEKSTRLLLSCFFHCFLRTNLCSPLSPDPRPDATDQNLSWTSESSSCRDGERNRKCWSECFLLNWPCFDLVSHIKSM